MSASFLADLLLSVTARGRSLLGLESEITDVGELVQQCEALASWRGDATGMALAEGIFEGIERLGDTQRSAFFRALAQDFGVDREGLEEAIAAWQTDPTDSHAAALHAASEPRRQELLRRLNRAPFGTRRLVDLRARLLAALPGDPALDATDHDFMHLFSSWFNSGFLELRRIDWSTPAMILEKLIRYEAVHAITDWEDLRRRIEPPDRRCYAFFHPAMGEEPLIFVEVAFTQSVPDAIAPILARARDPLAMTAVDTAIFYSISNCQDGLRGVSFGNFLIKQVVAEIARELPYIKTFATLSPIPGFAHWVRAQAIGGTAPEPLRAAAQGVVDATTAGAEGFGNAASALREPLLALAGHYFLHARNSRAEPLNAVARFHLGNGARLERINWLGDASERGIAESFGLMANYVYELKDIERNHEAFVNAGRVTASSAVKKLAKNLPADTATVPPGATPPKGDLD